MIPDYFVRRWLYEDAICKQLQVTLPTAPTKLLPYNPQRYGIIVPGGNNTIVLYGFGDQPPAPLFGSPGNYDQEWSGIISYDDIGGLILQPVWMWVSVGPLQVTAYEMSINPIKYAQMRRLLDEYIPKLESP